MSQRVFRSRALDELPDLAADGVHHLQNLGIGIADVAAEEFNHAHYGALERDREGEGRAEALLRGRFCPPELRIERHVGNPCRCAARPYSLGEPHAEAALPGHPPGSGTRAAERRPWF